MTQQLLENTDGSYASLDGFFTSLGCRKLLLVCGGSIRRLALNAYFETLPARLGISVTRFSDFSPNPTYESVEEGVSRFRETGCDCIAAVGGGSAMDVAKCIKLYAPMEPGTLYLSQEITPSPIPFLAVPTTAGTGSEATRFAVIYYRGEKQSVSHPSAIPDAVLLDPQVLDTLPEYQRKATMLDALCHSVESFWSVHATPESQADAARAIAGIRTHRDGYLANTPEGNAGMLLSANLAGKAINVTQTTAGHAMCYKLTSLYGLAHGHAAALCVRVLFPYMVSADPGLCADPRGPEYLRAMFSDLAQAMGCEGPIQAAEYFGRFVERLRLPPIRPQLGDLDILTRSVNPVRLKNNPVRLNQEALEALYRQIMEEEERK